MGRHTTDMQPARAFARRQEAAQCPPYTSPNRSVTIRALRSMVAHSGPPATIRCEPRQARKGATVAADSCAGVWLVWVATLIGEVSERSKEHAWKVCIRQRIEGSNPSLSARSLHKRLI